MSTRTPANRSGGAVGPGLRTRLTGARPRFDSLVCFCLLLLPPPPPLPLLPVLPPRPRPRAAERGDCDTTGSRRATDEKVDDDALTGCCVGESFGLCAIEMPFAFAFAFAFAFPFAPPGEVGADDAADAMAVPALVCSSWSESEEREMASSESCDELVPIESVLWLRGSEWPVWPAWPALPWPPPTALRGPSTLLSVAGAVLVGAVIAASLASPKCQFTSGLPASFVCVLASVSAPFVAPVSGSGNTRTMCEPGASPLALPCPLSSESAAICAPPPDAAVKPLERGDGCGAGDGRESSALSERRVLESAGVSCCLVSRPTTHVNVVPLPTDDCTLTLPPMQFTSDLTMLRPSPVPPAIKRRVRAATSSDSTESDRVDA